METENTSQPSQPSQYSQTHCTDRVSKMVLLRRRFRNIRKMASEMLLDADKSHVKRVSKIVKSQTRVKLTDANVSRTLQLLRIKRNA